jgi:hypothetical protein
MEGSSRKEENVSSFLSFLSLFATINKFDGSIIKFQSSWTEVASCNKFDDR